MRLTPPSLLVAATLSVVAACMVNSTGLNGDAGRMTVVDPDAGATAGTGVLPSGAAGTSAPSGAAGMGAIAGGSGGDAGATAGAGDAGGDPGGGTSGSGAAGSGAAGDATTGGAGASGGGGDMGAAGSGPAGTGGPPDASGTAGSPPPPVDAHPSSAIGCADGTREGLLSVTRFPNAAACSGAWTVPGLVAPETLKPQCDRAAGNDGDKPDGSGCSVADLCAEGWHVCESAHEFAAKATDCAEAFPGGGVKMFFATRQKGPMTTCDPMNLTGTNNVYGCGNFGSNAMAACAPFMRMLRDADCKNNPPWTCVDGPINYSITELLDVTKSGSDHGGVLCCR